MISVPMFNWYYFEPFCIIISSIHSFPSDSRTCPAPYGVNQDKEDASRLEPMAIELYHALEETNSTYSHFEILVLHQLQELNVSQN